MYVYIARRRPSSVSSADPLSPYAPSEPFSPPMTPGLPLQRSPLQSPPTHYHVTPQLHPKYLFSSFTLPWKKVCVCVESVVARRSLGTMWLTGRSGDRCDWLAGQVTGMWWVMTMYHESIPYNWEGLCVFYASVIGDYSVTHSVGITTS